jgi:hypothetical protein
MLNKSLATQRLSTKEQCLSCRLDTEVTKHLFPAPMQLPTHGQKWSNMATQRLLTAQCFARSGRTICTASHPY